ncbi:type II secretion system minor pseudopilin GspJ [Tahibacter amnicola]|uniref:Type II secretion system protein J n=1 Tax=Tahibacter amnicola TaxID=2976241 RepID=A0ABY6BEN1_9GAMM|nr:type II secretion system minor pseudopilin GspJ [Tahibacter amnicola]UXI67565.1 type II secretion system minor pseudopilin GspJ [Tahibacter amnicola]
MKAFRAHGFTLVEALVATAVFAIMSALAWGGLSAVIRSREALAAEQQDFTRTLRSVSVLERDLLSVVRRPVRDNYGAALPALKGDGDRIEFSHLGWGSPDSEARSSIERVGYLLDGKTLRRARYVVLDRAASTTPVMQTLRDGVTRFQLRYLNGGSNQWVDAWPPRDAKDTDLPRAIEFRLDIDGLGEVTRLIELLGPDVPPRVSP